MTREKLLHHAQYHDQTVWNTDQTFGVDMSEREQEHRIERFLCHYVMLQ